jgi:hypothetical protein
VNARLKRAVGSTPSIPDIDAADRIKDDWHNITSFESKQRLSGTCFETVDPIRAGPFAFG